MHICVPAWQSPTPVAPLPPVPGVAVASGPPAPAAPPAVDPHRARADKLLEEVGALERENKLLEARQRALEAVQLKAIPADDR